MIIQDIEHLNWRYATKKFDPSRDVSEADLNDLLETLRLAPSSFGLQPWKFIVLRDRQFRQKLVEHSWKQTQVVDASHLIVLCSYRALDENYVTKFMDHTAAEQNVPRDKLKIYEQLIQGFVKDLSAPNLQAWMKDQVYLALGFLMSEAARRRIDTCPMEGFDSAAYDRILDLESQNLKSVVLCPIGYRMPDDKYASLKKVRYPLSEIILYR